MEVETDTLDLRRGLHAARLRNRLQFLLLRVPTKIMTFLFLLGVMPTCKV